MAIPCKFCSEPLYFEVNSNGKYVPYEQDSREPHDCPNRISSYSGGYGGGGYSSNRQSNKVTLCNYCSKRIKFSTEYKSYNDKFVPLNYEDDSETGDPTPHMCSENPYYSGKKIVGKK
jgi:hypothetical protein